MNFLGHKKNSEHWCFILSKKCVAAYLSYKEQNYNIEEKEAKAKTKTKKREKKVKE